MEPTVLMVMALPRLFLTWVFSGVALQATPTVRAGRRAWAGCGESPCCNTGPAVIVNTSAAITALISRPIFLIPNHLSCSGGRKEGVRPSPCYATNASYPYLRGVYVRHGTKDAGAQRKYRTSDLFNSVR